MGYGTSDTHAPTYIDPEEQRKQREALDKLQQDTAEYAHLIIDLYNMLIPNDRRLINIVTPAIRPDLDVLARRDGPLFEEVFFGDLDKKEIKQQFREIGQLSIENATKVELPDLSKQPLIYEFNWYPN
jgi:hypothetical protein